MVITVDHRIPGERIAVGLVRVSGVVPDVAPAELSRALTEWIEHRRRPLTPADDACRRASRDMLRNGSYKPTGRGKPASEYLLRAANSTDAFPRINGPVDAINLVSLRYLVPISLWDIDRAGSSAYELRLGRADEQYCFNAAGQSLDLRDLVCGCRLNEDLSQPIVTPIKDSLATKIQDNTRCAAACIYFPVQAADPGRLNAIAAELLRWLKHCGPSVEGQTAVLQPGQTTAV